MSNEAWSQIFEDYRILDHDFSTSPYYLSAQQIKDSTSKFKKTAKREVRILCKYDTRESRPHLFQKHGLFLLPVKNGQYAIVKGEGYLDIPPIASDPIPFKSHLGFEPSSYLVGDSEMQHVDYAFASGLIHHFLEDEELVLMIRGRKYTPPFHFMVNGQQLDSKSVQTEVDAGYESENKIVLIEAKNAETTNVIIRQLFYPYRQWKSFTDKEIIPVFFEKRNNVYHLWKFTFADDNDYNSIQLVDSRKYTISPPSKTK